MSSSVSAATGYRVENPATGEIVERFDTATDEQIGQVIDEAQAAYLKWREKSIEDRAAIVNKVAALFGERKEELAKIIAEEMGKPVPEGIEEAEFSEAIFNYYADNGPEFSKDEEIKSFSGGKAYIQRRPVGVALGIMPWNFPYYQVARFAAPNLVLGNTIILKHAEICPRSAAAIQQIMDDAGVPKGVYTNVYASHDQVETIIADRRTQGVSLTGSERAGSIVGALAGKYLKKAVLELGGSDPYIILDTDNLDEAVDTAWGTRLYNTGQVCNANKRMIVMDDIYDDFVAGLTERAQSSQKSNPSDPVEGGYSPLSSRAAAENLRKRSTAPSNRVRRSSAVNSPTTVRPTSPPPCSPTSPSRWTRTAKSSSAPSRRSTRSRATTTPSNSPTTRTSASAVPCSRRTRSAPRRSHSASTSACRTSTPRPVRVRRSRSAARNARASAVSSAPTAWTSSSTSACTTSPSDTLTGVRR